MTTSDQFRPRARRPIAWGALGAIGLAGLILERVLLARAQGRGTAEEADHDDLDRAATGLPAHRRARAERSGPAAARPGRQDRQLPRRPTAPGRPRQGGHRLRGTRRRWHHPLRRRLPVPGRLAGRAGQVGPQHRHRDPGPARHATRGARGRDQPGPGQPQCVPDRQRRPGRPPRHHDPPARPGCPRQRLHLDPWPPTARTPP